MRNIPSIKLATCLGIAIGASRCSDPRLEIATDEIFGFYESETWSGYECEVLELQRDGTYKHHFPWKGGYAKHSSIYKSYPYGKYVNIDMYNFRYGQMVNPPINREDVREKPTKIGTGVATHIIKLHHSDMDRPQYWIQVNVDYGGYMKNDGRVSYPGYSEDNPAPA